MRKMMQFALVSVVSLLVVGMITQRLCAYSVLPIIEVDHPKVIAQE